MKQFACRYSYNNFDDKITLLGNKANLDKLRLLVWYACYRVGNQTEYLDRTYDSLPPDMQFRHILTEQDSVPLLEEGTGIAQVPLRQPEIRAMTYLPCERFTHRLEYPIRYGLVESRTEDNKVTYYLTPAGESYLKALGLK